MRDLLSAPWMVKYAQNPGGSKCSPLLPPPDAHDRLNYHLVQQEQPILIPASVSVKTCILQHCQKVYPRDDHRDFVNLVALMVGFEINVMHRARRIARFIYSMKIELMF